MSIDKAATSDADPPIARVALSRKQKAVNIAVSEIKPQNLKKKDKLEGYCKELFKMNCFFSIKNAVHCET